MRVAPFACSLGVQRGMVVAFTGGGGKTSSILRLCTELTAAGLRVAFTTTTHILDPGPLPPGAECVAGPADEEGKRTGLLPGDIDELVRRFDVVLVEADGSRGLPLKFPADHEPAIPPQAQLVVPVVGVSGVGREVCQVCHRWEQACAWLQVDASASVDTDMAARLLGQCVRGTPPGARVVPCVNQADICLAVAVEVARAVVCRGYDRVLVTAVATAAPVRAVVTRTEKGEVVRYRG